MDFKYLLTDFNGRIGRKQFWLGVLALIILAFILIAVLGFTIGLILPTGLVGLIGTAIILYPACALYTKRLHDRDKPQMPWLAIFIVPGILLNIFQSLGIGFTELQIGNQVSYYPSGAFTWLLSIAVLVVSLWALVELGFLKGTQGSNQFGEDPLAG